MTILFLYKLSVNKILQLWAGETRLQVFGRLHYQSQLIEKDRESNLSSKRPLKGPLFTVEYCRQRLRFARDQQSWTLKKWKNILFTAEMRVALNSPDCHERVWRRPNEHCSQHRVLETKIFTHSVNNYLINWSAECHSLLENQRGFRNGRGCTERIFSSQCQIQMQLRLKKEEGLYLLYWFFKSFW